MTAAPTPQYSSATEIALRLLQASSCFRPGAACGSLPCACAQSLVDALSPTGVREAFDAGFAAFWGPQKPEEVDGFIADRNRAWDDYCLSPQAQAGETNTDAEPSRCKNPVARGESMETDALTGDAPVASVSTFHAVAQAEQKPAAWFGEYDGHLDTTIYRDTMERWKALGRKITPLYASPPAALPAGQVVVTPEMVSAGMAEIPEDGAEYEHVEAAYRKMAALAIPSTNSNTEAKPSRLENLERQVLAHEKLQARIAGALGLETWHGDLADAVRVRLDAGPEDTTAKHSGTFLGYRDEHGNEMHCANAFCPHEDRCRKRCICPVAMSSTHHQDAAK